MSFTTRRGSAFYKRPLALIGATALTAGAMVPLAGAANAIETGVENTCAGLTDDRFVDLVGYTQDTQDAINCLASYGVTQGTGDGTTYEPGRQVLRWEMALFLDRLITYVDDNNTDVSFADNDDTSTFEDIESVPQEGKEAIARLADLGIADGFNDEEFGPYNPVLRRQMASFLDRIQAEIAAQSPDAEDFTATETPDEAIYLDVPPGHPQYEDIYSVSNAGIAQGTGADLFEPNMATTRSQMALFLTRHLDALVDQGVIEGEAVVPVEGNQDYAVTPDGAIEKPTSTDTTTNEGAVTFTFSNVQEAVKVALLPASNVTEDANGVVTFEDSDATANMADDLGSTETGEAQIEQVNGAAYTAGTPVNAVNGNVSVVVDSEAFDEAVVVVYNDADGDSQLNLDANNQPTEKFAVGGPVTWLPAEAANGTDNSVDIVFVDKARDFFIGDDDNLYYYESSDLFLYNEDDYAISFQEWETALSVGDSVDTYTDELEGYSRTARSGFDLYIDEPGTPTNVAAAVGDFDTDSADTGANDVRVTWSAPSPLNGLIQGYDVYQVGAPDTVVASVGADEFSAVVEDLAVGDYQFYVVAKSYTSTDGDASANANATVAEPPAPASVPGAPVSTSASFQDNNSNGVVDGGDVLFVTFNEAMAAPNADDSITLEDADGTAGVVSNGPNSTWTVSENERTLTITLSSAPVVDTTGTTPGVNYPATVTDSTGVTDTGAENVDGVPLEWDLTGSSDVDFGSAPPAL